MQIKLDLKGAPSLMNWAKGIAVNQTKPILLNTVIIMQLRYNLWKQPPEVFYK